MRPLSEFLHSSSPGVDGVLPTDCCPRSPGNWPVVSRLPWRLCKVNKIPKYPHKNLDRAHPTHQTFFGNPSQTWTEHSNRNNQQRLAMYIQAGFTVNGDILGNDRNFFVINLVSSSPLTSRHLDVYYNVRHIKT